MIEYKKILGSRLLNLNNCRDEDAVILTDKRGKDIKEKGQRSISCKQTMIKHFTEGSNIKPDYYKAFSLYQLSAGFTDDTDYPFNYFNILEHKEVWKKWLKAYINSDKNEAWAIKTDILPKQFYHLLYQYNMIVEDTHWISDEAKVNVQKIHDLEMPSSYFYELRDLINLL